MACDSSDQSFFLESSPSCFLISKDAWVQIPLSARFFDLFLEKVKEKIDNSARSAYIRLFATNGMEMVDRCQDL